MAFYWKRVEPPRGLDETVEDLLKTLAIYESKKMVREIAQVERIIRDLLTGLDRMAQVGPGKADEFIRARLSATAVRPPTSGTLASAIRSEPLPSKYPSGAIGVANLATLDRIAVDPRGEWGEYWRAQEFGTRKFVGRKIRGFFADNQAGGGATIPSQAYVTNPGGVHPYFLPTAGGGAGTIRRPLNPRHYLRDGTDQFLAWHTAQTGTLATAAVSRILSI